MTVRILQITDTHILPNEGDTLKNVDTFKAFERVFEHIQKGQAYSAILHTGDVAHDDIASYKRLAKKLKHYQKPIFACAGNHDNLLEMREAMRPNVQCVHSTNIGKHWQVLFLNSPVEHSDHGHITETDLTWLQGWLQSTPNKHTLIATHHHPIPVGSGWMDDIKIDNGEVLMQTLAQYQHVKGIVFGHVHQAFDTLYEHIRVLATPSTCIQFTPHQTEFGIDKQATGYRVLDLHDDGTFDTQVIRLKS